MSVPNIDWVSLWQQQHLKQNTSQQRPKSTRSSTKINSVPKIHRKEHLPDQNTIDNLMKFYFRRDKLKQNANLQTEISNFFKNQKLDVLTKSKEFVDWGKYIQNKQDFVENLIKLNKKVHQELQKMEKKKDSFLFTLLLNFIWSKTKRKNWLQYEKNLSELKKVNQQILNRKSSMNYH